MNDNERKVIIYKISEHRHDESGEFRHTPASPLNRWLSYAIMIPIVAVLVLIGIFFFAAFLALAAVIVAVLAARFWWMRKKIERAMQQPDDIDRQTAPDQTVIIEDAQVIEETETRTNDHKQR
ncbi:MAG: hypothetical protein LZF61_10950 [Nitrosomonas sp.]|nr:MAG: hypothetical protein LZF61_10950 [Nitrosomonas sp.]